jgi:hypothetical protein
VNVSQLDFCIALLAFHGFFNVGGCHNLSVFFVMACPDLDTGNKGNSEVGMTEEINHQK